MGEKRKRGKKCHLNSECNRRNLNGVSLFQEMLEVTRKEKIHRMIRIVP
jgi:hypothetical protein